MDKHVSNDGIPNVLSRISKNFHFWYLLSKERDDAQSGVFFSYVVLFIFHLQYWWWNCINHEIWHRQESRTTKWPTNSKHYFSLPSLLLLRRPEEMLQHCFATISELSELKSRSTVEKPCLCLQTALKGEFSGIYPVQRRISTSNSKVRTHPIVSSATILRGLPTMQS